MYVKNRLVKLFLPFYFHGVYLRVFKGIIIINYADY